MLDTVSYTSALGAAGDGNSLNRSSAGETFEPHTPSPGAAMSSSVIPPKIKPVPAPKAVASKKSSKTSKSTNAIASDFSTSTNDVAPDAVQSEQVAAVATTATPLYEWWLAAGALALASVGAIVFSRRYAKDEWDIVDDSNP